MSPFDKKCSHHPALGLRLIHGLDLAHAAAEAAESAEAGEVTPSLEPPSEEAKAAEVKEALLLLTLDHLKHYWETDARWQVDTLTTY